MTAPLGQGQNPHPDSPPQNSPSKDTPPMNTPQGSSPLLCARLENVRLTYGTVTALDGITLDFPSQKTIGIIGPDGVGKSSMLSLLAGARAVQEGLVEVLGGDMRNNKHRSLVCNDIAFMPQGLGKNLYPTLSIEEHLQYFGKLFGHDAAERRRRIDMLTESTGLRPFLDRPAGKLSGGMKQKLGLCCSLIHDPNLLILDEPTTGVDPLARSQFWDLIRTIREARPHMSVIVATAYMDEAQRFDWLVAMNAGSILATGSPAELLATTRTQTLEDAFITLLPSELTKDYVPVTLSPLPEDHDASDIAIEAQNLTKKYGNFTAVDDVSFRIRRGEIFGFLGSNGCGKTTTMKMLTGLQPATQGQVWLFGNEVDPNDMNIRRRLGYMTQSFSLYDELSVRQNLVLHARLFHLPPNEIETRVNEMLKRFSLRDEAEAFPLNLPLGVRQRLSLAVALIHSPEILILDEPTSGVDPVARDEFWRYLIELSRRDKVTIFITTHFMNEATRCDRISFMHAGKVLDSDTPEALRLKCGVETLEEAFVDYLLKAGATGGSDSPLAVSSIKQIAELPQTAESPEKTQGDLQSLVNTISRYFNPGRFVSCMWREYLELRRDPIRATLALLGSLILMTVIGYGITMDVEDLTFAVLDRDQTGLSHNYSLNIAGSRYFKERPPLKDYADLDQRMRNGDIAMALELPPSFAKKVQRGDPVEVGVWVDGSMPQRAETIQGYVRAMHQEWLVTLARERQGQVITNPASIEVRYRYNPDVKSLPAMVPAVIPLMLIMIPAMLAALSIVREKELGSIINLYTTPLTKAEFIIGKQIPYVLLALLSFLLMVIMAVVGFDVPVKGSFLALFLAAVAYCFCATSIGMLMSSFTKSQIAVMFGTLILTMLPAVQFSGLLNTVSSQEGFGRLIGEIYPTTHMLVISRGIFNKSLALPDVYASFKALCLTIPLLIGISIMLLKKQDD